MKTVLACWAGSTGHRPGYRGIACVLVLASLLGLAPTAIAGETELPWQRQPTPTRLLAKTEPAMTLAQAPAPVSYVITCPAPPPPAEPSTWPLWVAVGAVLVAGVAVGILYARQDKDLAMPITTFGAKRY